MRRRKPGSVLWHCSIAACAAGRTTAKPDHRRTPRTRASFARDIQRLAEERQRIGVGLRVHLHAIDPGRIAADLSDLLGQRLAARCQEHPRSEEHTSELQSLMRISYAVFCLKKKK